MKINLKAASFVLLLLFVVLVPAGTAFALNPLNPKSSTSNSNQPGQSGFCPVGSSGFIKVPCPISDPGLAGETTFGGAVVIVLDTFLLIVGSIAVIFLIWGGLRYITAAGSEETIESAKKTMMHAIWGLVIVVLSFAIVAVITNVLISGRP